MKRRVDAVDRVRLHREQEARRELRTRRSRVEKRRRRVRKPALRHEIVRLDHRVDVVFVNTDCDAHNHKLRTLNDFAVNAHEIGALERSIAEIRIVEVARVNNRVVEALKKRAHIR